MQDALIGNTRINFESEPGQIRNTCMEEPQAIEA